MNGFGIRFACLSFLTALSSLCTTAQQIQPFKTTPKSVIGYIEYLPLDYKSNNNKYPVVIFLHGKGQCGPTSNDPEVLKTGYNSLIFYGPPKYVNRGTNFPFILISPQLKNSYGDWPSWYVMEVIEYVKTYLRIDEKRIYLTGTSLGGGGAWVTAQDYPNYFAALAPVAGSSNSTNKACGIAASNLPVWAFHGDKDGTVPLSTSANMVNAINACGTKSSAKLTIYAGLGHNAYSLAYDPTHNIHTPNLYDWMIAQVNDGGTLAYNKPPTANAGPDNTVTLPNTIVLQGNGSDPDGTIIDYSWTKVSGGDVTLSKANTSRLSAYNIVAGTYVFRLTVHDNVGAWHADDVTVVVKAPTTNVSPVANAGADKVLTLPVNSVNITGTGSDADGSIASYSWTKVSGGNATLANTGTTTLSASNLISGAYVFRLTVKDNQGATNADDVNVNVYTVTQSNTPPIANAGSDKTITLPVNSLTLTGTGTDADGRIAAYTWTKVSGGNATLVGASTSALAVSGLIAGTYVFRLTVVDDKLASHSDDVQVIVNSSITTSITKAPTANAGGDKTIELPVNSVTLYGSGTTATGAITSYKWEQVAGTSITMQNTTSANLLITGVTTAGTRTFKLTVRNSANYTDYQHVHVYFTDATVARLATEDEVEESNAPSITLDNLSSCATCTVIIYNEMQQRIYQGAWHEDLNQQVFSSKSGFYFYHIVRDGKVRVSYKVLFTK